jgi:hypothetical protein
MLTTLSLVLLAAAPATPDYEVIFSEALLTRVLAATTPITTTYDVDLGAQKVKLDIKLSNPVVHISNVVIKVTVDYEIRDQGGLIALKGVATPEMVVTAIPAKRTLEARLTRGEVSLLPGVTLPLDRVIEPFTLPASAAQTVVVNGKEMTAQAVATAVSVERGYLRVKGSVELTPKVAAAKGK